MNFDWFRRQKPVMTPAQRMELEELCQSIATKLQKAGFKTEALSQTPREAPRDLEKRIKAFKIYGDVVEHHLIEGGDTADEKGLLWRFLSKMGYTPTSDIFDLITNQDYIEVYDHEGYQIYRSLNYFNLVSFTIEDLVTLNWKSDFKRDRSILLDLLEVNLRFATGLFNKTYHCDKVPKHYVREMIAKEYVHELGLKYISPLKVHGKSVALLAASNARRVNGF
jgi:hypothetical protein